MLYLLMSTSFVVGTLVGRWYENHLLRQAVAAARGEYNYAWICPNTPCFFVVKGNMPTVVDEMGKHHAERCDYRPPTDGS